MRTTSNLAAAGVVAVVLVALGGPTARAAEPAPDDHAWAATGPLAPISPEEDRVYVSQAAGQEQARAFVRLSGVTADDLVAAELHLQEGEGGLAADTAELQACALEGPVTGSGKVDDPPAADCATLAAMQRADGTWTLALASLADAVAAADGWLAITPVPGSAAPAFTVAFDTTRTRLLLPPSDEREEPPPPADDPVFTGPDVGPLIENPDVLVPPSRVTEPPRRAPPEPAAPPPVRIPRTGRSADDPPTAVLLVVAALAAALLWARARWLPPVLVPGATVRTSSVVSAGSLLALLALVSLLSEAAVYKLGFVAIVFVAAIGLHVLVNWSGELSLAHASFVGLPAFAVAQLADHTGWTPILFLPVGIVVGAFLGLVVAIPAARARGLQVALVTLAVGIAITQFLFVRSWVIGPPSGLQIPVPSVLGLRFETSRSLLPVLAIIVVVAVLAARSILASKIGRALSQIRAVPDAAATAGVPVAAYRGAAYAIAGAFAGLAGGTYVLWVQRVSPHAFPLNLGFTYLVIATLAGKGGLIGVAIAALVLEGGRLFTIIPESIGLYLGPIALIYNVTRYQEGINGVLRQMGRQVRARKVRSMEEPTGRPAPARIVSAVRLPVVVAGVLVVVGFAAIALAWYHAGNTDQLWVQNQELISGGIGGGGLIVLGSALLIRDALLHGGAAVRRDTMPPPDA